MNINELAIAALAALLGLAFYAGVRVGSKHQLKQDFIKTTTLRHQAAHEQALLKSLSPLRMQMTALVQLRERYEFLTAHLSKLDAAIGQLDTDVSFLRYQQECKRLTAAKLATFNRDITHASLEKTRLCTLRQTVFNEWTELGRTINEAAAALEDARSMAQVLDGAGTFATFKN